MELVRFSSCLSRNTVLETLVVHLSYIHTTPESATARFGVEERPTDFESMKLLRNACMYHSSLTRPFYLRNTGKMRTRSPSLHQVNLGSWCYMRRGSVAGALQKFHTLTCYSLTSRGCEIRLKTLLKQFGA